MIRELRRGLLAGLASLALVAAACGGDSDDASPEPTSAPDPTTASVADESSTDEPVDEAPPTEDADDTEDPGDPEPSTRTVTSDLGEIEVPTDVERVAVLEPVIALPTALDLGAPVVATWESIGGGRPSSSMVTEAEWDRLEIVGAGGDPNLEALAALDPDLILFFPSTEEEYNLVAEIAPTVPVVVSNRWQDDSLLVAQAFGKVDEMERQLADYQSRADDVGARIDAELGDPQVAILRFRPDSIRVHTSVHFAGNLLSDVGLSMPEEWVRERLADPVANVSQRVEQISLEQLGLLSTADHLIVLVQGRAGQTQEEVDAAFAEVESSALWQTLPAVQNDNLHFVESYWLAGSLRAANAALDDIEESFLGES
ncbi:MAG: iron-siderophore ABC transporter substrate-binding protein [Actinomycetota bacterium]